MAHMFTSLKSRASAVTPLGIIHISEEDGRERAKELSGNVLDGHCRGMLGCIPAPVQVSEHLHPWPSAPGQWAAIGVNDVQGPHRPLQCAWISLNDPPTNLD